MTRSSHPAAHGSPSTSERIAVLWHLTFAYICSGPIGCQICWYHWFLCHARARCANSRSLTLSKKISFSTFSRGSPEFPLLSLFGPKFADSAGAITWKGEADAGVFAASADVASCWKQMLRTSSFLNSYLKHKFCYLLEFDSLFPTTLIKEREARKGRWQFKRKTQKFFLSCGQKNHFRKLIFIYFTERKRNKTPQMEPEMLF